MTAALKLTTAYPGETIALSRKPRLGEKVAWQVSDWEKPAANDCCIGEKTEAKVRWPSGKVLYAYVGNNPLTRIDPSGLDWIYSQSTGDLSYQPPASQGGGPPAPIATGGYSGNGAGYNNPSMQHKPNEGPIPQGSWTIGTPYNSPNVGPFAIPLTPNPGTNDYGRTDFRIHGDNSCMCGSASEGCVIYNRNIRNEIINSGDTTFIVVP